MVKYHYHDDVDESYRTDSYGYVDPIYTLIERGEALPDGRMLWKCEQCKKYQHPDHDMTRSVYYQFSGREGPFFCGYQCMMTYRNKNDAIRFAPEEPQKQKSNKKLQSKKQWKIKNSVTTLLETSDSKQQQNILNALHAVVTETSDE